MREPPSPVRAAELRRAVRRKYREVAVRAEGQFPYPTGRESALRLGYDERGLEAAGADAVAGFVGVGTPFAVASPTPGARVLDLGCGCGLDVLVAAQCVGLSGHVTGVDLTMAMLERARLGTPSALADRVRVVEADLEELPFDDASFDLALSNGV